MCRVLLQRPMSPLRSGVTTRHQSEIQMASISFFISVLVTTHRHQVSCTTVPLPQVLGCRQRRVLAIVTTQHRLSIQMERSLSSAIGYTSHPARPGIPHGNQCDPCVLVSMVQNTLGRTQRFGSIAVVIFTSCITCSISTRTLHMTNAFLVMSSRPMASIGPLVMWSHTMVSFSSWME